MGNAQPSSNTFDLMGQSNAGRQNTFWLAGGGGSNAVMSPAPGLRNQDADATAKPDAMLREILDLLRHQNKAISNLQGSVSKLQSTADEHKLELVALRTAVTPDPMAATWPRVPTNVPGSRQPSAPQENAPTQAVENTQATVALSPAIAAPPLHTPVPQHDRNTAEAKDISCFGELAASCSVIEYDISKALQKEKVAPSVGTAVEGSQPQSPPDLEARSPGGKNRRRRRPLTQTKQRDNAPTSTNP